MKNLDEILKGTSRAFYLTLKALPAASRELMSLAYLLARAADTIADSECEGEIDRSHYLVQLSAAISDPDKKLPSLDRFCPKSPREKELLNITGGLVEKLHDLADPEQRAIQDVVRTLMTGMLWDQGRFGHSGPSELDGLDDEEFEEYCYLVAGCVGPFWSKICVLSNPRLTDLLTPPNLEVAKRFGKALQYVNILRDVPADQEMGRYYLPELSREDFCRRFLAHSHRALAHFRGASLYPSLFETWNLRDKIAVLLPLVLGLRTLEKLFISGPPRPNTKIKVKRSEVLTWLAVSPVIVILPNLLPKLLNYLTNRAENALNQLEKTS